VSEELRSLLRDELSAERPPPLGDLVGTALRDGRRIRRNRRFAVAGGGTAVAGVVALAMALGSPFGPSSPFGPATATRPGVGQAASSPEPTRSPATVAPPATPTATIDQGRKGLAKATPEAMLVLLKRLIPEAKTSQYAKTKDGDLHVQMYLDRGKGPGMIRVMVSGDPDAEPEYGSPKITVEALPDNCIQSRIVRADWAWGLAVEVDLATCLAWDGKENVQSALALTDAEASKIVADPRWGLSMDTELVRAGIKEFPNVAYFG